MKNVVGELFAEFIDGSKINDGVVRFAKNWVDGTENNRKKKILRINEKNTKNKWI